MTIVDLLWQRVRGAPDAVAFVDPALGEISYAAFWSHAAAVATLLAPLATGRGRVLVVGRCSYVAVVCELAAWFVGRSTVGLDPEAPACEAARVISTLGADIVVFTEDAGAVASATSGRLPVLRIDARTVARLPVVAPREVRISPRAEAFTVFTSGTTGEPRGLPYRHEQLALAAQTLLSHVGSSHPGLERSVAFLPLYHLTAKVALAVNLVAGITTHFVSDPKSLARSLVDVAPDFLVAVPRVLEKVVARIAHEASGPSRRARALSLLLRDGEPSRFERACLPRLFSPLRRRIFGARMRFCISGSAPLRADVRAAMIRLGVPVFDTYGVSEVIVPIAMGDAALGGLRVLAGQEVRIAADGEILVRGAGVSEAVLGPEAPDGFYATGDIGLFDDGGRLVLRGRKRDVVKTSTGVKIFPAQVESVYRSCEWVDDVVVFGDGRPYLVAIATIDAAAARALLGESFRSRDAEHAEQLTRAVRDGFARLNDRLPRHERVGAVAVLPRGLTSALGDVTTSGKVRRSALAERYGALIDTLYAPSAVLADPAPVVLLAS